MEDKNILNPQVAVNNAPVVSKKPRIAIIVMAILLLVALVGYFASAYFVGLWPFGTDLNPRDAFKNSFYKLASIKTASYDLTLSAEAVDRQPDMTSMSEDLLEYRTEQAELYKRDADRFRDMQNIRNALDAYYKKNKSYPSTVLEAKQYDYKAVKNLKANDNFALTITFETDEAINTIKGNGYYPSEEVKASAINGKTVTFDKDTLKNYYYFSSNQKLPAFLEALKGINQMAIYIPANFKGSIKATGATQKQASGIPDGKFGLDGEMSIEDFSAKFGFEFLKKAETFYFRLNQFPGFFGLDAISKIKGKWVKITADDIVSNSAGEVNDVADEEQKLKEQILSQLELFFNLGIEDSVFTGIDNPKTEKLNNKEVYNYSLSFDKSKLPAFYEKLSNKLKEKFGEKAFLRLDDTTLEYMKSPAFEKLFDYMERNIKFNLYVDKRTGYPVKFNYKVTFLPDKTAASSIFGSASKAAVDKALVVQISLGLSDINKAIDIEEPKDSIMFDEARQLITGESKEDITFKKQIENINSIRTALKYYKVVAGVYPGSLSELAKNIDDIPVKNSGSLLSTGDNLLSETPEYVKRIYKSKPLLKVIPKDAYSKSDYSYSVENGGNDYKLVYKLEFPAYQKGQMPNSNIFSDGYKYDSKTKKATYLYSLKYEAGTNVATEGSLSVGAKNVSLIDSDKDELSDSFEKYLGTDPNKSDTDNDGTSDGAEIQKRYNPLGPGTLEWNYSY